ncbi:hypothetical protein FPV67DRAFT_1667087 [Lyophyllum atratum]|nr:hypothetical protein FPV67DRAFT_1667087 [Lyophyllum atratum]
MDSILMSNSLNISNDPFSMSLSSFEPTTTFFDSFAPPNWPWMIDSKLEATSEAPLALPEPLALSQAQFDAFKYELASPVPTPCDFFFEFDIEPDTTKYEAPYDEFGEIKQAVLKELVEKAKAAPAEEPLPPVPPPADALPIVSLESFFEDAYTLPDTFMDDFWLEMGSPSTDNVGSPSSSISASTSTSASTSSSISTPPSSIFTFACSTPEPEASTTANWFDRWDCDVEAGSVDDNPDDGDYQPFKVQNRVPVSQKKAMEKRLQQYPQAYTNMDYLMGPFPAVPDVAPRAKPKRKALPSTPPRNAKRQKLDAEVVCRINGCRHVAKTRFECFKHRETHFPGRFQCPHPACRKVFVRSSSLSRHLKRPRNGECGSFAGCQADWGVGLVNFELHPPAWNAPGFLDEITEL